MKYRIYIDETGNADLGASSDPNHRFLSLTGAIFSLDSIEQSVYPDLEELKKIYFKSHPDEPVILHRKEIINKRPPFDSLEEPEIEEAFNTSLLNLHVKWDYRVVTVTIDKLMHRDKYSVWKFYRSSSGKIGGWGVKMLP
jgi:hypothetical protein